MLLMQKLYMPYFLSDNSELSPQYTLTKCKTSSTSHANKYHGFGGLPLKTTNVKNMQENVVKLDFLPYGHDIPKIQIRCNLLNDSHMAYENTLQKNLKFRLLITEME